MKIKDNLKGKKFFRITQEFSNDTETIKMFMYLCGLSPQWLEELQVVGAIYKLHPDFEDYLETCDWDIVQDAFLSLSRDEIQEAFNKTVEEEAEEAFKQLCEWMNACEKGVSKHTWEEKEKQVDSITSPWGTEYKISFEYYESCKLKEIEFSFLCNLVFETFKNRIKQEL
jgi:hypothetical protein